MGRGDITAPNGRATEQTSPRRSGRGTSGRRGERVLGCRRSAWVLVALVAMAVPVLLSVFAVSPSLAQTTTTTQAPAPQHSSLNGTCDGIFFEYFPGDRPGVFFGYFLVYLILLVYIFVGVSVTAEYFMQAIEFITSQKKTITEGDNTLQVHVWNGTVANLTLMALGSSAPEILLSVVEVVGNDFDAGELGPGTIVGSAAFNMLIIIAVCVNIKKNRGVKRMKVFYVTFAFSVFAYIWLYMMVGVISETVIEPWEGVVTVLFFPVLVAVAWMFDRRAQRAEKASKSNLSSLMAKLVEEETTPTNAIQAHQANLPQPQQDYIVLPVTRVGRAKYRAKLDAALKEVQRTDPNLSAAEQYIEANRIIQRKIKGISELDSGVEAAPPSIQRGIAALGVPTLTVAPPQIGFVDANIVVHKSHRAVSVRVARLPPVDGTEASALTVRYKTVEGTAYEDVHYKSKDGVLLFPQGKEAVILPITIDIYPDTPHHRNKNFSIQLESTSGHAINWKKRVASVTIQQRPHADNILQALQFWYYSTVEQLSEDEEADTPYMEQIRAALRIDGGDDDDEDDDDDDDEEDEEEGHGDGEGDSNGENGVHETSYVSFQDQPKRLKRMSSAYRPGFELPKTLQDANNDDDDDEDGTGGDEIRKPLYIGSQEPDSSRSVLDYFLFVFFGVWNVLFAILTPPSVVYGGWATFGLSLAYIGVLTAIVGDLATGLGCTIGLEDTVTAITFVALGTSVPDIFASKIAAEKEPTADDAIGNVTGSNAVNVFLGVGIAWLLGSAVRKGRGETFEVNDPALGFSVVVFCLCALIWFAVLYWRKSNLGCELGGPKKWKKITIILFLSLWFFYILLSSLVAYNIIRPGF